MRILKESSGDVPCEGYFWYINDKIVGVSVKVPQYGYEYQLDGKTHKNTWSSISQDYLINGKEVPWDYFPRGRVMIDPEYDSSGKFEGYTAQVFADVCLNTQEVKDKIIDYYNLYKTDILWFINKKYSVMNHYICHQCRKED